MTNTNEHQDLHKVMLDGINREIDTKQKAAKAAKIVNLPVSNKTVVQALSENEFGDAALFVMLNQDKLIYDHAEKDWYYWNDHFWRLDKLSNAIHAVSGVIGLYGEQLIYEQFAQRQAEQDEDEKEAARHEKMAKALSKRIGALRMAKRAETVLRLASRGVNRLATTGDDWDKDPYLFGCRNGCIDLRTGDFFPGRPSDLIRTTSPIKWEGFKAPRENWEKFLMQMNDNDEGVVDCLQRLLGYGITGLSIEHIFPIFWGSAGRNGKGTLFETLKYILGPYMYKAPANFLIDHAIKGGGTGPDAVTMGLYGKRLVWLSETKQGDRLDTSKLKELVGGDTISARLPYGKRQVEFTPSHLMLIITNMRPRVPANDPALWQRLLLFPLKNSFIKNPDPNNPHEFLEDQHLGEKLQKEAPGILAWLVEGCLLWQEYGIKPPDNIRAATDEYRQNEDIIADFLQECCYLHAEAKVERKVLYASYRQWCQESGNFPYAKKRFYDDMAKRFSQVKIRGFYYCSGVDLIDTKPSYTAYGV
jgi:putative DNA primase/helicase